MSALYNSQAAGLAEVIDFDGGTFQWNGRTIKGIIDHVAHNITTLKSYFGSAAANYPKCGQPIIVNGKKFQITKRGNAELKAVEGGFIEDPPFVDDPSDPSLDLTFDKFIKR